MMSEIVVGLDLSPGGAAALRWAADQARRTTLPLRAVHVVQRPHRPVVFGTNGTVALQDEPQLPEGYRHRIESAWNELNPEVGWRLELFLGEPGPLLTEQAEDAALLVVGTHLHVGLGRVFPGSVSHYCLTHSRTPMVAVPGPAGETDPTTSATHHAEPESTDRSAARSGSAA
jgi:nucleotide-binding universal stress UspA family protein